MGKISVETFIERGYKNFKANDMGNNPINDGSSSCGAGIIFYRDQKQVYETTGKTGSSGGGHAEMVALSNMIEYCEGLKMSHAQIAKDFCDGIYTIDLSCENKSCCVQCSVVLGIFNVEAFDFSTTKCKKTMLGGGAWGFPPKVKSVIKEILKVTGETIDYNELNYFATSYTQYYKNLL